MKKELILIDDKDYGLKQITLSIPESKKESYELLYYSSYQEYQEKHKTKPHIVLLDFFLNKDSIYSSKIVHEINADIIICFSSWKEASDAIMDTFMNHPLSDKKIKIYSVQKLKITDNNEELKKLFKSIL